MSRKGAPGALAARTTDQEQDKGRVDQTRVKRYWAGKAPEWASTEQQIQDLQLGGAGGDAGREVVRTEVAAPVIVQRKADPRLARLAATRSEDIERTREEHREIRAAEVVRRRRRAEEDEEDEEAGSAEPEQEERRRRHGSEEEGEEEDKAQQPQQLQEAQEEDEEEADKRRQAVRERLREQQRALEAAQQQQEEEEEEEEDESEYETDSEDEGGSRRLLKPVFVPKQARETIAEREQMEAEEEALREYEKTRQAQRKVETRELVKTVIESEEAAARAAAEEASRGVGALADVVTDDDEAEEATEFESWKQRELARVRRDREARQKQEREAAEREKLRNMTDEERRAWELANPKRNTQESKEKWKFMQKYWHKGAFFQEAADDERGDTEKPEIFSRDFSAPTGEDKWINKELLPKVMQVRNFGRSGRTKWTHLLAEDTTQLADASPLLPATGDRKRQGGYGGAEQEAFAKPKKFRT